MMNESYYSYCILIGSGLVAARDYHLLVDMHNIKIDVTMTEAEYSDIVDILNGNWFLPQEEYPQKCAEDIFKYFNR